MRFSRLGLAVLFCSSASAQKPVGITDFVGNWLDYYHAVSTTIEGDHDAFTAWASGTTLGNPNVCDSRVETCTFPDVSGLPIVGLINDGHVGNCSGNIELLQLSKLPTPFQTATSANTLLTPYPNCFSSYGGAPGDTAPYSGHLWYQAGGDGNTNGTWKGTVMAFRNSVLLAPFYRQNSPGDHYGDSSMMLSPDAGRTWIDYSRYNSYTVTSTSCAGTTATLAVTGASGLTGAVYVHDVGPVYNGKHTVASASSSQITYSVNSCAGASGSTGAFGPLDPYGSAPPYAAGAMMWSSGAANPMGLQAILNYGQDGNYPAGIEPACDPALYVCGIAYDAPSGNFNARLWRVPVGKEMVPTSYQWYTCPGYSSQWPAEDTACNGNLAGKLDGHTGEFGSALQFHVLGASTGNLLLDAVPAITPELPAAVHGWISNVRRIQHSLPVSMDVGSAPVGAVLRNHYKRMQHVRCPASGLLRQLLFPDELSGKHYQHESSEDADPDRGEGRFHERRAPVILGD